MKFRYFDSPGVGKSMINLTDAVLAFSSHGHMIYYLLEKCTWHCS